MIDHQHHDQPDTNLHDHERMSREKASAGFYPCEQQPTRSRKIRHVTRGMTAAAQILHAKAEEPDQALRSSETNRSLAAVC